MTGGGRYAVNSRAEILRNEVRSARALVCDVSSKESVRSVFAEIHTDIPINSAWDCHIGNVEQTARKIESTTSM